jgi:hypothetical protein
VTLHFALVEAAVKNVPTVFSTRVADFRTINYIRIVSAVALGQFLLSAWLTGSRMTIALAFMHSAIEGFLAFLATLEGAWVFTAPKSALGLAALAGSNIGFDVAGRAFPRVALKGT